MRSKRIRLICFGKSFIDKSQIASLPLKESSVRVGINLLLFAFWLLSLDFWHVLGAHELAIAKEFSKLIVVLDCHLDMVRVDPDLLVSFGFSSSKFDDFED